MKSQAKSASQISMELRRVLKFNGSMGLTLPGKFARALDLHWKDYVEVSFVEPDMVMIQKHEEKDKWPKQISA